jgi:hypothetical protein
MRETETEMLIAVFGGHTQLAQALHIETYAPEIQSAILRRFCEYVFKKVLLDVPHEEMGHVIDIFEKHRTAGRSFDALVEELRALIPGMDDYIAQEIDRSVELFRLDTPA